MDQSKFHKAEAILSPPTPENSFGPELVTGDDSVKENEVVMASLDAVTGDKSVINDEGVMASLDAVTGDDSVKENEGWAS